MPDSIKGQRTMDEVDERVCVSQGKTPKSMEIVTFDKKLENA